MNFLNQFPPMPRPLRNFLRNGKVLPRWARLSADLFLMGGAFFQTFFLLETLVFKRTPGLDFLWCGVAYIGISLLVICISRLHTGLLRYSNTQDIARVFTCLLLVSALYYLFDSLLLSKLGHSIYPALHLLLPINFLLAFFSLIMLRVGGRIIFYSLMQEQTCGANKQVLIYGCDAKALLLKQALEGSQQTRYHVLGFIDGRSERLHRLMERRKVYAASDVPKLANQKKIDEVVMLDDPDHEEEKRVVWGHCLQSGIRVVLIPPVEKWLTGKMDQNQMRELQIEDLLQRDPIKIDQQRVQENLTGRRILITGAAGSIGAELVRKILPYQPALLLMLDQAESPLHALELEIQEKAPNALTEIVLCDIRNRNRLESLFDVFRPELVFHAAAYKHVPMMERNALEAVDVNLEGTQHLADLSRQYKTETFVMISTDKAVNPTNVMGATKRLAEMYIQALNGEDGHTRFITTRFGNVLGSNGSVIPTFYKQIKNGGPLTVTHPEITRYFMTISEAVELVLQAGTMGKGGELFVFDMGKSVKITDLARKMIQLAGLKEGRDIAIVYTGLRPGEKLYEELLTASDTVLPTYHEKIHIARVQAMAFSDMQVAIHRITSFKNAQRIQEMVHAIKQVVPEFISQNSPFQDLDCTIQEIPQTLPQV